MSVCESCHAGCCRSFAVPVTGADILRIETELALTFWDFVCRWEDPDGQIARNHAPHFHFRDEPKTPFVICLMHEESRIFAKTSKCRFLVESPPDENHPLGIGRCGIHPSRPSACRAFPTKLNDTGELAVIYDVPSRERKETEPVYTLCPRPWTSADCDPLTTVQDLVVAKYEMKFFQRLAELWNRAPGDWQVFPDFLRLVYSTRVVNETDVEAEQELPATLKFPVRESHSESRAA